MVKIGVVGAGIIGLSSAICIQKSCPQPDVEITLITEKLSPFTTGDGAAGIWLPYLLSSTSESDVYRWAKGTHDFIKEQWRTEDGGRVGMSQVPVFYVSSDEEPEPLWKNIVYGYRKMQREELAVFRKPSLKTGYSFVTFTIEAPKLLPHFLQQFQSSGGKLVMRRIENIKELQGEYDIIVNCTGIQANRIVPDPLVQPKRGQVMRVTAPSIKYCLLDGDDDGNYIIPNQDSAVLGGTHQEGDWNTEPYPEDTEFIKTGCARIIPSLKHAPLVREWVGLRPGRPAVRLELEKIGVPSSQGGKEEQGRIPFTIVHNYGHGGSGLTLFWGCALHAAELVREAMQLQKKDHESFHYAPKSKL